MARGPPQALRCREPSFSPAGRGSGPSGATGHTGATRSRCGHGLVPAATSFPRLAAAPTRVSQGPWRRPWVLTHTCVQWTGALCESASSAGAQPPGRWVRASRQGAREPRLSPPLPALRRADPHAAPDRGLAAPAGRRRGQPDLGGLLLLRHRGDAGRWMDTGGWSGGRASGRPWVRVPGSWESAAVRPDASRVWRSPSAAPWGLRAAAGAREAREAREARARRSWG